MAWTYERVAWYRERMDALGVAPGDIRTLEDVQKLPFTDKSVLRDTFPYGLFAVPLDEVVELHASSSGTTGKPIVVGYNAHDMDVWSRLHRAPGADGGRRARRPRADGVRLRHVHRGLRAALRPAEARLHDDPRRLGQHRAPHRHDRGLRHHGARGHALLRACTCARWGSGWASTGRRPRCAWACSAASPARRASRPRSSGACTSCAPTTTA